MAHREKLHGIVRSVLLEADIYEASDDSDQGAKNIGLTALYLLAQPALAMFGIGLVSSLISDALENRKFNRIEQIRADQRDGTLTLHVRNKSQYPMRVKSLMGGYCTTSIAGSAPGTQAAFSIMGINDGTVDVHKFFSDMPNPAAIELKVEQRVAAGEEDDLDVPVDAHEDTIVVPYTRAALRSGLRKSARKGDFGPLKKKSPEYKAMKGVVKGLEDTSVENSFGSAPFVSAHALVLVTDFDGSEGDAVFYMPVGFDRKMQHTIVLTDKIARKAMRKMVKLVGKLKPGEAPSKFAID